MPIPHAKEIVMLQFSTASGDKPTEEQFRASFGLAADEFDETAPIRFAFGGELSRTFYAFVTREAGERIERARHPHLVQIFSDPKPPC